VTESCPIVFVRFRAPLEFFIAGNEDVREQYGAFKTSSLF
jgi:hypothetical protein